MGLGKRKRVNSKRNKGLDKRSNNIGKRTSGASARETEPTARETGASARERWVSAMETEPTDKETGSATKETGASTRQIEASSESKMEQKKMRHGLRQEQKGGGDKRGDIQSWKHLSRFRGTSNVSRFQKLPLEPFFIFICESHSIPFVDVTYLTVLLRTSVTG